MSSVDLEEAEWSAVMAILSTASWRDANPLLMKIGQQLRMQQTPPTPPLDGKRQEARHD